MTCRSGDLVVDGQNLASFIFGRVYNAGLSVCCNPTCMYEEAMKFINLFQNIGLRVIKVFADSISNLDKIETYIERRLQKDTANKKFWDMLVQQRDFTLSSCGRDNIDIPNCCQEAVIKAFIDTYGEQVMSLGGIDTDRYYYCFGIDYL